MNPLLACVLKAYRRLLALYPAGYRQKFGVEMEEVFARELAERAEGNGFRALLLLLHEARDLPYALWRAHRHERHWAVAGPGAALRIDALALRLRPWSWGMIAVLFVVAILYTFWLGTWSHQLYYLEMPVLQGSSAIILENKGELVRVPPTQYRCEAASGRNQAVCTAEVAGKELRLVLTMHAVGTANFSGYCSGSYAGQAVQCVQLFARAADYSRPPIAVTRPHTLDDAQWAQLLQQDRFTYPNVTWWFQWGVMLSLMIGMAVGALQWLAARVREEAAGLLALVRRSAVTLIATVLCALPLTWLALLISLQVEEWLERF